MGTIGSSRDLARQLGRNEIAFKRMLIAARERAGMKSADVARKLGVDRSWVSRFERLDSDPKLSAIAEYAHAIGALVTMTVTPADELTASSESGDAAARLPSSTTRSFDEHAGFAASDPNVVAAAGSSR